MLISVNKAFLHAFIPLRDSIPPLREKKTPTNPNLEGKKSKEQEKQKRGKWAKRLEKCCFDSDTWE